MNCIVGSVVIKIELLMSILPNSLPRYLPPEKNININLYIIIRISSNNVYHPLPEWAFGRIDIKKNVKRIQI